MTSQLVQIIAVLFAAGAGLILALSSILPNAQRTKMLWHLYWTEVLIVSAVLVPSFVAGNFLLLVLIGFGIRGQYEIYDLYSIPGRGSVQTVGYIVAALIISFVFFREWYALLSTIVLCVGLMVLLPLPPPLRAPRLAAAGTVLYPIGLLVFIPLLIQEENGVLLLCFVYGLTEIYDSMALVAGKFFGGPKITPRLSPHKTAIGTVFGLCCAFLVALATNPVLLNLTTNQLLIAASLVLTFGMLGDLFTSKLKRARGRKDFRIILQGQGGILDLYDALLMAVPAFYLYYHMVLN